MLKNIKKASNICKNIKKKIIAQVGLKPLLELIKGSTWILEPKLGTITNNGRSIKSSNQTNFFKTKLFYRYVTIQ